MRLYASTLFLTLVVSGLAANSAPVFTNQPGSIEMSPKDRSEPIYASSNRTERSWALRVGYLGGAVTETNQAEQLYFYGFRYDFSEEPLSAWQLEVTTAKNNFLHFVVGKKFYFPLEETTRPYYKWSVGNLINSTEGLGSVVNIKKIQAMAAIGLDDLFHGDQRLQGEIGIGLALIGPQIEMSLGIPF